MTNLIPEGMDRAELAAVLREMAELVEAGDSFEGHLEYSMPVPDDPDYLPPSGWPSADAEFWVTAVYRIGNLQGQGGMRMIGMVADRPVVTVPLPKMPPDERGQDR